jgi:hypothetical protein
VLERRRRGSDRARLRAGHALRELQHGDNPHQLAVTVTLSRSPAEEVYVVVEDPEGAVDATRTSISVHPNGEIAWAYLFPSCALAPGTHAGALTVSLCRDAACASRIPLSGNTLPYAFTVADGVRVTATLDGIAQPGYMTICGAGGLDFDVRSGQVLELTATESVTWGRSMAGASCFPAFQNDSFTATRWTATIVHDDPYGVMPAGAQCGFVEVHATPASNPHNWVDVSADLYLP